MDTISNNQAGFQWKVFSIGRTNKIQVECNMNIKRVLTEVTTTSATATTTTTTMRTTTTIASVETTTGDWITAPPISEDSTMPIEAYSEAFEYNLS